jgi:hypothetical protein
MKHPPCQKVDIGEKKYMKKILEMADELSLDELKDLVAKLTYKYHSIIIANEHAWDIENPGTLSGTVNVGSDDIHWEKHL